MNCPKCGNKMILEWEAPWFNLLKEEFIDRVYHCDNCDYDITQTINKNNEEIERKQFRRYLNGKLVR